MDRKDWYAWINMMPPKPDDLHIIGDVFVCNPGVQGKLCVKHPQGINPSILLLDLHLIQQSGMWPQVMTWIQVRYDKTLSPGSPRYTDVDVVHEGTSIAHIKVVEVQ